MTRRTLDALLAAKQEMIDLLQRELEAQRAVNEMLTGQLVALKKEGHVAPPEPSDDPNWSYSMDDVERQEAIDEAYGASA